MASLSASTLSVHALASFTKTTQGSGRLSNIVSLGWAKSSFPTLRSASRLHITCAAKAETVDKVVGIVKKQLALAPDTQLGADSKFSQLGADSLDTVEIVMALEEEFDITVEEEGAQSITTIQEAADVIEKLLDQKTAA